MASIGDGLDATTLTSDRLLLEPLRVDHAEAMAPVLSDPDMYVFTGGAPPTVDELRRRYARQVVGASADGSQRWLNWVVLRRTGRESVGEAVGFVQATVADANGAPEAEVAWVIGTAHQGNGFAHEAAGLMTTWLRQQGVVLIFAHVHPDHGTSAGVAERIGLAPTDRVEDGEVRWQSPLS